MHNKRVKKNTDGFHETRCRRTAVTNSRPQQHQADDDGSLQWLDLDPLGEYEVGVVSLARVHIYPDSEHRSTVEEVQRERTSSLKPIPKVRWTLALQPGRVVLYVCIQSTVFHLHRYPDRLCGVGRRRCDGRRLKPKPARKTLRCDGRWRYNFVTSVCIRSTVFHLHRYPHGGVTLACGRRRCDGRRAKPARNHNRGPSESDGPL